MCFLLIRAEAEGSTIPEAVPVEGLVPETRETAGVATESAEVAEEKHDEVLPE
jgi:hypothetical protein